MLGIGPKVSVKHSFRELGILTVYGLLILQSIMYVMTHQPQKIRNHTHQYFTRNQFTLEKHSLELFKNKTSYKGLHFLRFIPNQI